MALTQGIVHSRGDARRVPKICHDLTLTLLAAEKVFRRMGWHILGASLAPAEGQLMDGALGVTCVGWNPAAPMGG